MDTCPEPLARDGGKGDLLRGARRLIILAIRRYVANACQAQHADFLALSSDDNRQTQTV